MKGVLLVGGGYSALLKLAYTMGVTVDLCTCKNSGRQTDCDEYMFCSESACITLCFCMSCLRKRL